MINWSPLGPCDLCPYKLSISAKPISATPSLDILKKKILELDIIHVYFVLYQTSKSKGTRMILIDNIYQE